MICSSLCCSVQTLQPFLLLEPSWVPGLSNQLIGKERLLAGNWATFLATMLSRISRMRCTLTVLDSNTRIDSDGNPKKYQADIAAQLEHLSVLVKEAMDLIAAYIQTPFEENGTHMGDVNLKDEMTESLNKIKAGIHQLVYCVIGEVQKSNTVQANKRWPDAAASSSSPTNNSNSPSSINLFRERHKGVDARTKLIRDRLGADTIDCWHRIYPMRTFCTTAVQYAVQTCTCLVDVIAFIEFISNATAVQDFDNAPTKSIEIEMQRSSSFSIDTNRSGGENGTSTGDMKSRSYSLLHQSPLKEESMYDSARDLQDNMSPTVSSNSGLGIHATGSYYEHKSPTTDSTSAATEYLTIDMNYEASLSTTGSLRANAHDDEETVIAIEASQEWSQYSQIVNSTVA
jgi:hypothetical protein